MDGERNIREPIIIRLVDETSSNTPAVRKKRTSGDMVDFLCSVITPIE